MSRSIVDKILLRAIHNSPPPETVSVCPTKKIKRKFPESEKLPSA
tara:strand:- start:82 stop:216 length:135 start_codon:yes stop_codon:yes gene_type:complete